MKQIFTRAAAAVLALALSAVSWAATADNFTDLSGTITTGGTSQTLAAANPGRKSIHITHSTAETEVLCVNVTSAASCSTQGSYVIAAGGFLCLNTKERVNIVAATTGHKFTAKEGAEECPVLSNGGSANISGATDGVAQGSSTSGQSGVLTQGAVTTSAPTYTTGQTSPLSIDTSGNLRVAVTGGAGSTISGSTAHDAAGSAVNPVAVGGYASAAAPTDVSADTDIVRGWYLRSGAAVVQPTYAGVLSVAGNGASGTGVQRVTIANDSTPIGALTETAPASDTASSGLNGRLQRIAQNLTTLNTSVNADPNYTGVIGAATAPTRMVTNGGVYNSTPPTLTNGQSAALQVSSAGRLLVDSTTNQTVNVAQINGTTPAMDTGNSSGGTQRHVIATNQPALPAHGHGAIGSAVPSGATLVGVQNSAGNMSAVMADPCMTSARTFYPVNISTATTTRIITPTASQKAYLCGVFLMSAGTQNVGIVEGTGGTCGTSTAGVIGGTTAGTGPNLTAQVGFVLPNTGFAQAATAGTNVDVCLITSAAVQLSGVVVYAKAP